MVQLVEVVKSSLRYELREVFVNPRHVVMLREDHVTKKTINEKKMIEGLDDGSNTQELQFTMVQQAHSLLLLVLLLL